jgi:hypothetical protein
MFYDIGVAVGFAATLTLTALVAYGITSDIRTYLQGRHPLHLHRQQTLHPGGDTDPRVSSSSSMGARVHDFGVRGDAEVALLEDWWNLNSRQIDDHDWRR